jgi:DeoR family transcriptional regulator of aga operon
VELRSKSYELSGPLAESTIEKLNIGKMFLGVDGISLEQGLTTYSELEAQIGKRMIERSNQAITVFDHSKVNRMSLFTLASLTDIDICITDKKMDPAWEQALKFLEIQTQYADLY